MEEPQEQALDQGDDSNGWSMHFAWGIMSIPDIAPLGVVSKTKRPRPGILPRAMEATV